MSAFQSVPPRHLSGRAHAACAPRPPQHPPHPALALLQAVGAELGQQLARQSFILQARYEVFKDRSFGAGQADAAAANGPANGGGGGGTGVVISG